MKRQFQDSKHIFRPRLMGKTRLRACLLSLVTLLMTASLAQAGRPGGVAVLLPFFIPVQAPQPYLPTTTPFDITGFIQTATVDGATPGVPLAPGAKLTDYFAGGTVEVNGLKIVVPRNTVFQMPATSMTWADMFMNAPTAYQAAHQSGLAMSDTPKPLTTYELHIIGNRVVSPSASRDEYVAGLIYISQQSLNINWGIINAFDYSKCTAGVPCMPDIWVGSTLTAKTGARLRLNTPNGRYGAVDVNLTNGIADKRFTADEDNPTIVARTGYPMCVPRFDPAVANDSLCPQWNRPTDPFTGAFSVNYTFPAAPAGAPLCADTNLPGVCNPNVVSITHQIGFPTPAIKPDPFEQTPLEVGDNISYIGNLVQDAPCAAGAPMSSCQYTSAHTVVDELGLFTFPSTWPAYLFQESLVFGVGGTPNPIFPQEAVEKIFANWLTTDFSQLVDVYSEDVDSTTGALSHRFYGSSDPFGPPLGGLKGRARFRVTIGNFLPPTRNVAVATRSLTGGVPLDTVLPNVRLTANGLKAGYYTAPDFGFIFPENLILGSLQIPLPFQEFPFLANGSGPYVPFGSSTGASVGTVGQISPWPGSNAPPVRPGTGLTLLQPPVGNAGPPQTVPSGSTVTLSAAGSTDTNIPALPLVYTWQQLSGPPVIMQNFNTMLPMQKFVAPTLASGAAPVTLAIQLAVCNGFTCGGVVTVNVTVVAAAGAPSVTLSASKKLNIAPLSVVTLTAVATCGGPCPITDTWTWAQTSGQDQGVLTTVAGPAGTSIRSFTAKPLPAGALNPALVTFTATDNSVGGTSTATISVVIGSDTITVVTITYQLSHSKLQVSVTSNALPKGAATLVMTPLINNKVVGPDVVLFYDPILDGYLVTASITNPVPDAVHIRSNYGADIITPVVRIR